jgi:DNA-binding beta-propeller fold protein YncE
MIRGLKIVAFLLLVLSAAQPSAAFAEERFAADYLGEITGAGGVGFDQPTDIAVSGGRLYVLDGLNQRVAVFDLSGNYLFRFSVDLRRPVGICADKRGELYVPDAQTAIVRIYTPDGKDNGGFRVAPARVKEKPGITDCAVSQNDEIFLADNSNHHIHVYDRSGRRLRWFGNFGSNDDEFRYPATVAIDVDNIVYVTDVINNSVKGFRASGEPRVEMGGWGITPGKLFRPKGVMLVGKHVYVTDSYTGAVHVFASSGAFYGLLGRGDGGKLRFRTPTNMALAGSRFFIVEQLGNRVSMWKLTGARD